MPDDRVPFPPTPNPDPLDDDTEPLVFDLDDEPSPPTQPGVRVVEPTLPGSQGLDPNPDFSSPKTVTTPAVRVPPSSDRTVQGKPVQQPPQVTQPGRTVPHYPPATTQPVQSQRPTQAGPTVPNPTP